MAEAHRNIMARLNTPIQPVFIDTPAGFELNIDQIDQKAVSYFKRNFGLDLAVARYRSQSDGPDTVAAAINAIRRANYLFAGPGSPSYAVRTWRDSQVWQAVLSRWREGAALVFSSGAAVSLGQNAIPVYEIYKCGQEVNWIEGLNILAEIGVQASLVPHWNNNSGNQYDTRFCFMGAPRLAALEAMLPPDVMVIGVDEYAGFTVQAGSGQADVFGAGTVTIRKGGHQTIYEKGQHFALNEAVSENAAVVALKPEAPATTDVPEEEAGNEDIAQQKESVTAAIREGDYHRAIDGLMSLVLIANAGVEQSVYNRAEIALQAMQTVVPMLASAPLGGAASSDNGVGSANEQNSEERAALIGMILKARDELRKAKLWSTADELRDGLQALGVKLSDTLAGTNWQRN
jgi:cyanophycinase-like exopeptidase